MVAAANNRTYKQSLMESQNQNRAWQQCHQFLHRPTVGQCSGQLPANGDGNFTAGGGIGPGTGNFALWRL
jgi:hypothetical protein